MIVRLHSGGYRQRNFLIQTQKIRQWCSAIHRDRISGGTINWKNSNTFWGRNEIKLIFIELYNSLVVFIYRLLLMGDFVVWYYSGVREILFLVRSMQNLIEIWSTELIKYFEIVNFHPKKTEFYWSFKGSFYLGIFYDGLDDDLTNSFSQYFTRNFPAEMWRRRWDSIMIPIAR